MSGSSENLSTFTVFENPVGKSKKNASKLTQWSPLCHITCSDNTTYTLCSCVRGVLLEINEQLVEKPELLHEEPQERGYVAIVMSDLKDFPKEVEKLMSAEDYHDLLEKRKTGESNN